MGKIKNAFYRFMYGRYGNDKLNNTLLWCYAALVIVYMVVFLFVEENPYVYIAYLFLSWTLLGVVVYRSMSRNIQKRRSENERFVGFFKLMKNKHRDRKTHVYRKCPTCRAVLRLPKAKGKHSVVCPRCKNRFEVKG